VLPAFLEQHEGLDRLRLIAATQLSMASRYCARVLSLGKCLLSKFAIFSHNMTPDWKMPTGVSRGLWDYLNDEEQARQYDERLVGSPLLNRDLQFAARWFGDPGRLVDLGCGTGRLLIPLARQGFTAVGIDLSAEMLRVAAEKARSTGVALSLLRANLVELDALRDACCDYAACLFSTLGMIHGVAERRRALGHFYRILRPGGRLVLHVHNAGFHIWTRAGRRWWLRDRWRKLLGMADFGDFVMPAHRGLAGLALHHYTRREIVRELHSVGFRLLEVEPVSLREDSRLPFSGWFGCFRAYGYLIAAQRR
jgi:ubiquinone/menaquinone biosynthesis C-methylase UbiE